MWHIVYPYRETYKDALKARILFCRTDVYILLVTLSTTLYLEAPVWPSESLLSYALLSELPSFLQNFKSVEANLNKYTLTKIPIVNLMYIIYIGKTL
mgnify:CR=1 FL=1